MTLRWRIETELDNAGFAIYRSTDRDGNYTKLGFVPGAEDTETSNDYQFTDKEVKAGKHYFYYLEDIDLSGKKSKSEIIEVVVPSGEKEQSNEPIIKVFVPPAKLMQPSIPKQFALRQNYPNPFNPESWLPYQLSDDRPVIIRIYGMKGQLIRTLDFGHQKAGYYVSKGKAAYWDGRSRNGEKVASGVYYYQLQAGEFRATRKMVILK